MAMWSLPPQEAQTHMPSQDLCVTQTLASRLSLALGVDA